MTAGPRRACIGAAGGGRGPPFGGFSFGGHFIWEFLHAPQYAGLAGVSHLEGKRCCLLAKGGDVAIAELAYGAALGRREYGPAMPVLLGAGLSPLLQRIAVQPAPTYRSRRSGLGGGGDSEWLARLRRAVPVGGVLA